MDEEMNEIDDIAKLDAILKAEKYHINESDEDSNDSDNSSESVKDESQTVSLRDLQHVQINFNDFSSYDEQVSQIVSTCTDANLKSVLILNRTQKALLIEAIQRYRTLLDECDRKLKLIKTTRQQLTEQTSSKGFAKLYRCGIPFFKDKRRNHCPPNQHIIQKTRNNELSLVDLPPLKLWLTDEKEKLSKAVTEQSRILRINILEQEKISVRFANTDGDNTARLEEIDEQIEQWRYEDNEKCIFPISDTTVALDWDKIAVMILNSRHSPAESKAMWYINLHPDINNKPLTKLEITTLEELVTKYDCQNWDQIALELGNNRSGYTCCLYFMMKHSAEHCRSKWQPEEDAFLLEIIEHCRIGNVIPWGTVAYYMDNHTKSQIYNRYTYTLAPNTKKGRFSKEEDTLLLALIEEYGKDYPKIATFMPNRNTVQIRDRYSSVLQYNGRACGSWTIDEDIQIHEFVKNHGEQSWAQLAKVFRSSNIRNRNHLRHRWGTLRKYFAKNPNADIRAAPRVKSLRKTNVASNAKIRQILNYMKETPATTVPAIQLEPNERKVQNAPISRVPFSLHAVNKALSRSAVVILENDNQIKFKQFFLKTCTNKPWYDSENSERNILNILFMLQVLDVRLDIDESIMEKPIYRYAKSHEQSILKDAIQLITSLRNHSEANITEYVEKRQEGVLVNPNESPPTSTWHMDMSLAEMLPNSLRTIAGFQAMVVTCKVLLRHFVWHETELEYIYAKRYGRYVRIRTDLFKGHTVDGGPATRNTNVPTEFQFTIATFQDFLKHRIINGKCKDLLPCEECTKCRKDQSSDKFKKRFLSFFSLPTFTLVVDNLVKQISDTANDTNIPEVVAIDIKPPKKRGRPRKILPGGRFKYKNITTNVVNDTSPKEEVIADTNSELCVYDEMGEQIQNDVGYEVLDRQQKEQHDEIEPKWLTQNKVEVDYKHFWTESVEIENDAHQDVKSDVTVTCLDAKMPVIPTIDGSRSVDSKSNLFKDSSTDELVSSNQSQSTAININKFKRGVKRKAN